MCAHAAAPCGGSSVVMVCTWSSFWSGLGGLGVRARARKANKMGRIASIVARVLCCAVWCGQVT